MKIVILSFLCACFFLISGTAAYPAEDLMTIQKQAEQGDVKAQFTLGHMYKTGQGIAKDDAQAVVWFRKAAEQGNASAQYGLGHCYATGEGIAKDYAQALVWYRKAAEQGHTIAQNNLASMYSRGEGTAKDFAQAVAWYRKAAEKGYANAQFGLGWLYEKGLGVAKDDAQAVELFRKSAAQGYAPAQQRLNELNASSGSGVAQNEAKKHAALVEELSQAVSNNDIDEAKALLAKGAGANSIVNSVTGERVIDEAIKSRDGRMLELLISSGAEVNYKHLMGDLCSRTPLGLAVRAGNPKAVKILLDAGATPAFSVQSSPLNNGYGKQNLLSCVDYSQNNAADVVNVLLAAGIDPNKYNDKAEGPPLGAASYNYPAIYALLKAGADPNGRERNGVPLIGTIKSTPEGYKLLQRLVELKADVNLRDGSGNTPLINFARRLEGPNFTPPESVTIVELFLASGARVNAQNNNGNTALHEAVATQTTSAIKALLEGGADPGIANKRGQLPRDIPSQWDERGPELRRLLDAYKK